MANHQSEQRIHWSWAVTIALVAAQVVACTVIEAPPTRKTIHVSGTPYERGKQHGEQLESRIRSFYTTILTTSLLPFVNRERPDIAANLTEYQDPKYDNGAFADLLMLQSAREMEKSLSAEHIDEMKGIADGAGMEYEQILVLNTFLDTVMAVRAIAYVLRLGQAPRLLKVHFIGSLETDGFDNDGDGNTDEKNEGKISKYEPSPYAVMADVPLDAVIQWRLSDPEGIGHSTIRVQLGDTIYESDDPALTTTPVGTDGTTLDVRLTPAAPLPAAATLALIIQAGDTSEIYNPPPLHARFMRDERLLITTAGAGMLPQHVPNRSIDDGRSQPPASALALRGSATKDGQPLLGQHFSLLDANSSHKHGVVIIHHPENGESFVTVGWAGLMYGLSGMNVAGLAAAAVYSDTLDNRLVGTLLGQVVAAGGDLSAGRLTASGTPIGFGLRHILEKSSDALGAEAEVIKISHTLGWNYLLADAKGTLRAVEVDSGAVTFPPKAEPTPQSFTFGPGHKDKQGRPVGSVGVDDLRIGAHYQVNTKDVMVLPVTETVRIDPQNVWSSYYYKSLRVHSLVGDMVKAGYGTFDVPKLQTLLGDKAVVDTSDSMNAAVYEPATRRLHSAMGAVPATSMPFETVTLTKEAP